jgi:hypothetical protein
MSASKKSGQLTCYQTGQFYLLPTRPCRDEDIVAFSAIYGHHVLTGTGTFEIAPTEADRAGRRARWGAQIFGGHG